MTEEPGSRPGPAPSVDPEEFVATVEELYEGLDERRGVTVAMVADELDIPERTVRYHLNGLSTQGRIADAWDHDRQPRRVYLPSNYE